MADIDTLRPEVLAAMDEMDRIARIVPAQCSGELRIIRAELLRLAKEVDRRFGIGGELIAARRERDEVQAELAALKARIEGSHLVLADGHGGVMWPVGQAAFDQPKGRRFRLVVDNEPTGEHADSMEEWARRKVEE